MTDIKEENARRNALVNRPYDPVSGLGCGGRRVEVALPGTGRLYLPEAMIADPKWHPEMGRTAMERLRCRHDFEFWAWRCVRIKDKLTARDVAFVLNRAQRKLLEAFESQRLAGKPVRVILLKSRQWGGSTLTQIYMAWIQIVHRRNWHSLICAHVKDTAALIRGMYAKLLENYPEEMWDEEDGKPKFSPVAGTANTRAIAGRGCNVTIGTYEKPEASRGSDFVMAHLSEVAFWRKTPNNDPDMMVQAIAGGIARVEMSLIVLESTARGVGSYFHRQWLRAERGESGYVPVFVAWHEVDFNRQEVEDAEGLFASLTGKEMAMWEQGLTLEQIAWYREKSREMGDIRAEHPATPAEAFATTGSGVFSLERVEALRADCRDVDVDDEGFEVWEEPELGGRYVVTVDVGGRSAGSDYSVVAVVGHGDGKPRVCAQWRGHMDYDLLAAKAAGIARCYNDALLVIESNTPENISARTGEPSVLLDMLGDSYPNFYYRRLPDGVSRRPGFHTNRATKAAMIANLQGMVRDGGYVERSHAALDELLTYELLPGGGWAARSGCHDDLLMTRAMALYVIARNPDPLIDYAALSPGRPDPDDVIFI